MKTIILYYTFGGSTKKEAERLAKELNATTYRVKETRNRCFLAAFVPGGFYAMKRKTVAIQPIKVNLKEYDRIILGCPVWAAYPAPAFNSIVEQLPAGKEVGIFLCSGGGDTKKSEEGTKALIEKKGCKVISYQDVVTSTKPGKMRE